MVGQSRSLTLKFRNFGLESLIQNMKFGIKVLHLGEKVCSNCMHNARKYPPGKYMFMKYWWNIPMKYSWNIRKKFTMKFRGIFPNDVPGILNIGIFPECSLNILRMSHAFFRWIKKYNSSFLYWIKLFLIFTVCL